MVKMNATLLEKTEELTLYNIQLKKTINKYQTGIKQLKPELAEWKALMKPMLGKK